MDKQPPTALWAGAGSPVKKKRLSWQMQKHKWQYHVLSAFRRQFVSSDEVYEQNEQRFLGLLQKLLDIRKSIEHYRTTALPIFCSSCASLGADVWSVVSVDAVGKGTDAEKFRHAMCAVNESKDAKSHYVNTADAVLSGAVRFLDIHINAMKSSKSQILQRKQMKLEFDCYEQKVARLKMRRNSVGDCQRIERNEDKLERARDALQTATLELYRVFAKYESERDTMLNGELEMVRQVMHSFYAKNAEATAFVIPEEVDRSLVDQRREAMYNAMVDQEMQKTMLQLPAPPIPSSSLVPPSSGTESRRPSDAMCLPPPPVLLEGTAAESDVCASDEQANNRISTDEHPEQPEHDADEDEVSEKLRTIQLSLPTVAPLKAFRLSMPPLYKPTP